MITSVTGRICHETFAVEATRRVPTRTAESTSVIWLLLPRYCAVSPWALGMIPSCHLVPSLQLLLVGPIQVPTTACAVDEMNRLALPAATAKAIDFRMIFLLSQ